MDEHPTESPDDSLLREAARAPDRPILFGPFSHYTILDRLGAGGMGEVYRARDTRLGRLVALKVLPGQLADDPERLSRFVREAQAASSLNHPCIVTVYEIGNAEVSNWAHPIHYIAMELVEGETLREYLTRSTVLSHWMDVLIEVCDGLGKAHAAGIVHRDLKPDNVMVTADKRAKILDFGIAKVIPYGSSDGLGATESVSGATETAAGVVMGTVGYMAPEQVRGEPVDARADVFALGCILYEAATGKRAFEGNTAIDTLHAILHSDPTPIGHLNTLVPEALDRIVRSCLAKDRASRFPSAREVGAELRGLREGDATFARRSTRKARGKGSALLVAGLAVLVVGIGVAIAAMWPRAAQDRLPPAPKEETPFEVTRITQSGRVTRAALSPDAKYVAYVSEEAGGQEIRIRDMSGESDVRLLPPGEAQITTVTFAPDGRHIYYVRHRPGQGADAYRIAVLGGAAKRVRRNVFGAVRVSPDGRRLAALSFRLVDFALAITSLDGVEEQVLPLGATVLHGGVLAWSPDGKKVAVAMRSHATARDFEIREISLDGTPPRPLTMARFARVFAMQWLSEPHGLFLTASVTRTGPSQIWHVELPGGAARRMTNDSNSYRGLSVAADGKTAVSVQTDRLANVWLVPLERDAVPKQITAGGGPYRGIAWSPDRSLVYGLDDGDARALFVIREDGSDRKKLTASTGHHADPIVSPDGSKIAYCSDRSGATSVWVMDREGESPRELTRGPFDHAVGFSPDGRSIYYSVAASASGFQVAGLYKVAVDGGEHTAVTDRLIVAARISPDGRWLASLGVSGVLALTPLESGASTDSKEAARTRSRRGRRASPTSRPGSTDDPKHKLDSKGSSLAVPRLLEIPRSAVDTIRFRPDSQGIGYVDTRNGISNVWQRDLRGGSPRQLTRFGSGRIWDFDWAPDGKSVACIRGIAVGNVVRLTGIRRPRVPARMASAPSVPRDLPAAKHTLPEILRRIAGGALTELLDGYHSLLVTLRSLELMDLVVRTLPAGEDVLGARAAQLAIDGKVDEAVALARRAAERPGALPFERESLADTLVMAHRLTEAEAIFRELAPRQLSASFGLSLSCALRGDGQGAQAALADARRVATNEGAKQHVDLWLGWLLLAERRLATKTLDAMDAAAEKDKEVVRRAWVSFLRAAVMSQKGQWKQALAVVRRAAERARSTGILARGVGSEALRWRIWLEARQSDADAAEKTLREMEVRAREASAGTAWKFLLAFGRGAAAGARGKWGDAARFLSGCHTIDFLCAWERMRALAKSGNLPAARATREKIMKAHFRLPSYLWVRAEAARDPTLPP